VEKIDEKENMKMILHPFKAHVRVISFVSTADTFMCIVGGGVRSSFLTTAWRTPPVTQAITGALIFRMGF
jgi:hypothetical protein